MYHRLVGRMLAAGTFANCYRDLISEFLTLVDIGRSNCGYALAQPGKLTHVVFEVAYIGNRRVCYGV